MLKFNKIGTKVHIMTKSEIAKTIKLRRKELNITQKDLALLSGISLRQLSKIERANVSVTIETLNKICSVLGLRVDIKVNNES